MTSRTESQRIGQLPPERVNQDCVFDKVGVDYAGTLQTKLGGTRKPVVKSYIYVCFTHTKAVHLEAITDLTTGIYRMPLEINQSKQRTSKTLRILGKTGKSTISDCRRPQSRASKDTCTRSSKTSH